MNVSGHYIRTGQGDSAEMKITQSSKKENRYRVEGLALWGEKRSGGPNMGSLDFTADLEGNVIRHSEDEARGHLLTLTFSPGALEVQEENWTGIYGMNVNFQGGYQRATPLASITRSLKLALSRLLSK